MRHALRNEKYIGVWPWGKKTNVRNPLTGQIKQKARPAEEAAKWVRERPELRLIDDETFFKAQAKLDESEAKMAAARRPRGQFAGSVPGQAPPRHLLQGLIKCGGCGANFQVSGASGNYLGCGGCNRNRCPCKTRLPRKLGVERLLRAIGQRVFAQPQWVDAVVQETQLAWEQGKKDSPGELAEVQTKLTAVDRTIDRLLDAIERGDEAVPEVQERLQQRTKEKRDLERRRAALQAEPRAPGEPPTRAWVESQLRQLEEVLKAGGADANAALGNLVGGKIVMEEAVTPGRKRKYLVGRFTLSARAGMAALGLSGPNGQAAEPKTEEVLVSFGVEPPWAALADTVKALIDQGLRNKEVARRIGGPRSWVPKALIWWHEQRGLTPPDGRARNGSSGKE